MGVALIVNKEVTDSTNTITIVNTHRKNILGTIPTILVTSLRYRERNIITTV